MNQEIAEKLVRSVKWHHDWEVYPGVRTNGAYNPAGLYDSLRLPTDMRGTTLADVGASNGYYSFRARSAGAAVTAFDYRHEDNSGFGLARHINGMADIPHHQVNILTADAGALGRHDVVLCMGLLYHTPDPYRALSACCGMCADRLFVETRLLVPDLGARMRYMPAPKSQAEDQTNYWEMTPGCLMNMLDDLGFRVLRQDLTDTRMLVYAVREAAGPERPDPYAPMGRAPTKPDMDDPASWRVF